MSLTCQSTTNRAMITLPIFLFLAVFANANSETINGVTKFTTDPIDPTDPTDPPLKDGDKCNIESLNHIKCKNDRLIFCGPTNVITSSPCNFGRRQGFCNCEETECVAEKPNCGNEDVNCLTPNTKLPDNLNCHRFSYCDENSKKMIFECPAGLVYDPNKQECTDASMARCTKVVCPKVNNTLLLIPFPQARNYYVLCYQGIGDVRKCSDNFYAIKNKACHFDCKMVKKVGLFRDTNIDNCRKGIFYSCKKSGLSFTTLQYKCSPGKYFNEKLQICTGTDTCEESTNPPSTIKI